MLTWDLLSLSALVNEFHDVLGLEPHRTADADAGKLFPLRKLVHEPLGAPKHFGDFFRAQEAYIMGFHGRILGGIPSGISSISPREFLESPLARGLANPYSSTRRSFAIT
jgi:hypothetical protein